MTKSNLCPPLMVRFNDNELPTKSEIAEIMEWWGEDNGTVCVKYHIIPEHKITDTYKYGVLYLTTDHNIPSNVYAQAGTVYMWEFVKDSINERRQRNSKPDLPDRKAGKESLHTKVMQTAHDELNRSITIDKLIAISDVDLSIATGGVCSLTVKFTTSNTKKLNDLYSQLDKLIR